MKGKPVAPKPVSAGKRQIHYLEIKGYPGRAYVGHFEFGRHFDMGGGRNNLRLPSPILIYAIAGYRQSPLFRVISDFYERQEAASYRGGPTGAAVIPECMIGVETKENGQISHDIILKLKHCKVIDHRPDQKTSGWIKISFFDSEKTWVTW